MKALSSTSSRGGFTLLELMLGCAVMLLLIASLMQSLTSMSRTTVMENLDTRLQADGERALRAIVDDLKRSGFAVVGPKSYPYLFEDGNAQGLFAASAHAAAVHHAVAGDRDFGPNREIVFAQPQDADTDSRPDLDGNGNMIWSPADFSYVLVTRADGANILERRIDGANPRKIARGLERVTFDDNTTSGFQVPLRAIRVRLWFRQPDERGTIHRYFTEAVVKLRNG